MIVAALLVFSAGPALAQSNELVRLETSTPVDVRADKLTYDDKTNSYLAEGEVEITQGANRLVADKVRLFSQSMIAEAEGNVSMVSPSQVVSAASLVVNLNTSTGKLYDARIFLPATHYYLRGEEIVKTGEDTYTMAQGGFTTCDGDSPNWEVTGSEVDVTIEGYGTAKNTAFRIKDMPVLWSPYMVFPVKTKRQSGLLPPMFGQGQRDGFLMSLPYYHVLGEDQDATITLNVMTSRGVGIGAEYRYALDEFSKGMIMADLLPSDNNSQSLYEEGKLAEPYDKRWWVRGMADQKLFGGAMEMRMDLDLVSDRDYMREFTFGYTGFNTSSYRLAEMFNRTLEPNSSWLRTSKVNLLRYWSSSTLNMTAYYFDQINTDNKSTLQQLPAISYDAVRQAIDDRGMFYFQMTSDFTYYYRETGSTGAILNFNPAVSAPLNFRDYLEVEPVFTWNQRLYSATLGESEDQDKDKYGASYGWNFQLKNSTYLYRVYDFGEAETPFKVKHAVRPKVDYLYRPNIYDGEAPELAQMYQNRLNYFRYGFNNAFTYKYMQENEETGEIEPVYREFLKVNVFQVYSLDERSYNGSSGMTYTGADNSAQLGYDTWDGSYSLPYRHDGENFGNFGARVEFDPWDGLYFESDVEYDPYESRIYTFNSSMTFSDYRGDMLSFDYRYTHDILKQLRSMVRVALNDKWSVGMQNRHDFDNEMDFDTIYQLEYNDQCWGVRVFYRDDSTERGFFLVFSIGGFGEIFGTGFGGEDTKERTY